MNPISFMWWAATTFLMLGFIEAVIKPIAKRWMQRKLIRIAPAVFSQVDRVLPELIQDSATPQELEDSVRKFFEDATGEDWSKDSLDSFFQMYDLRKAIANRISPD